MGRFMLRTVADVESWRTGWLDPPDPPDPRCDRCEEVYDGCAVVPSEHDDDICESCWENDNA